MILPKALMTVTQE